MKNQLHNWIAQKALKAMDGFAVPVLGRPVIRSTATADVQGGLRPIFGAVHWFEPLVFSHHFSNFG